MRPDHTVVTIQREGRYVTARTSTPSPQDSAADRGHSDHPYSHLTAPLRRRGLVCTVEFGLSDYIVCAELPDGSAFVISPPQEPPADHPPGYPGSWLVTRGHSEDPALHEVVYDSAPDGPHARSGGSITDLLAAIGTRMDQLGVPYPQENTADSVLHRAGFVPVVRPRERFHRLPAAMTDPAEQRQAVTRAIDMLRADGFVLGCDADLLDPSLPVRREHPTPLGDQIARLTQSITQAGHTSEAVAVLSELTAPGNGVLDRVIEALEETANWWEGLGAPADPLYADKLRRIAGSLGISTMEIQAMRSELADRHTGHPLRGKPGRITTQEVRVAAALASSPTARPARPVPAHATPAALAAPPAARPSSAPGR